MLCCSGVPGGSDCKESVCSAGYLGLICGSGRSSGKGNGYPHQNSCLENLHGQRNLAGYSPWGHKELMWLTLALSLYRSAQRVLMKIKWDDLAKVPATMPHTEQVLNEWWWFAPQNCPESMSTPLWYPSPVNYQTVLSDDKSPPVWIC